MHLMFNPISFQPNGQWNKTSVSCIKNICLINTERRDNSKCHYHSFLFHGKTHSALNFSPPYLIIFRCKDLQNLVAHVVLPLDLETQMVRG